MTISVISESKYAGMVTVGYMSACLSILGSSAIISFARHKLHVVYHRVLLALSACDIMYSFTAMLHPWTSAKTSGLPWAIGTDASCSAVGFFFTMFTLAVPLMNFFLSFYFMLAVKYSVSDQRVAKYWEPAFYLIGLLVPLCFASVAIKANDIHTHDVLLVCTLAPGPSGCTYDPEMECTTSLGSVIVGWAYTVTLTVASLGGFYCTIALYLAARNQITQSERTSYNITVNGASKKRLQRVSRNALLYSIAYFNGFVWVLIQGVFKAVVDISDPRHSEALYAIQILSFFFLPLQGFWNSIIYFRPRWWRLRKANPSQTLIWTLRQTLSSKVVASRRNRSRVPRSRVVESHTQGNQESCIEAPGSAPPSQGSRREESETPSSSDQGDAGEIALSTNALV